MLAAEARSDPTAELRQLVSQLGCLRSLLLLGGAAASAARWSRGIYLHSHSLSQTGRKIN